MQGCEFFFDFPAFVYFGVIFDDQTRRLWAFKEFMRMRAAVTYACSLANVYAQRSQVDNAVTSQVSNVSDGRRCVQILLSEKHTCAASRYRNSLAAFHFIRFPN